MDIVFEQERPSEVRLLPPGGSPQEAPSKGLENVFEV